MRDTADEACTSGILTAITIDSENGSHLVIVLGEDETVFTFDSARGVPPFYASRGEGNKDEPIFTCYLNFEHHSEFPRKSVIPMAEGWRAVQEFVDCTALPKCVNWEEV